MQNGAKQQSLLHRIHRIDPSRVSRGLRKVYPGKRKELTISVNRSCAAREKKFENVQIDEQPVRNKKAEQLLATTCVAKVTNSRIRAERDNPDVELPGIGSNCSLLLVASKHFKRRKTHLKLFRAVKPSQQKI